MRALLLLLALATGCATAQKRDAVLSPYDVQPVAARLGGDEASAPIASLGTWVPAQTWTKTLLGQALPVRAGAMTGTSLTLSALSGASAISLVSGARIYWGASNYMYATGSDLVWGGAATFGGDTVAPSFTISGAWRISNVSGPKYVAHSADGVGAVAHKFDTNGAWSGAGAALTTWSNNGTLKASVDINGVVRAVSYLQTDSNTAGAPLAGDCNADNERGRLHIDTTNNRLYVCNGASRAWDYVSLTD